MVSLEIYGMDAWGSARLIAILLPIPVLTLTLVLMLQVGEGQEEGPHRVPQQDQQGAGVFSEDGEESALRGMERHSDVYRGSRDALPLKGRLAP